jgi:hypothetical protein
MEFDKTKGFCNGLNIHGDNCGYTFHEVVHAHPEVTIKSCKDCSCPPARAHRAQYGAKRREMRLS